ncbi:TetR family transcriptional regulator [Mycobacterium antarcticum]|uniref:TetR/AcrR family transcriptional regulator C-terminal domain-containing protein n=1 Tax=unclassified Mycolicibacterium TaxID=2636767 RepID=UPI0023A4A30D|nr:TetR family transcriptional regulator [Mycolicibacterium sp. TUM20985]GLP80072.1 TetR family transcriptional regulator [Mycolicibacterium sp. TUM20984]
MVRARFTRDEIASAALQIVDESGLSALSMRSLASALGTGPMTMYNYVTSKEALEELVVAAVVAAVSVPPPGQDWRHDLHAIATEMWRGVRAHRAAIPLVLTRRMASATGFAIVDALVVVLGRADLTDRDRLAAFHAVFALVIGSAQAELAGPLTGGASEAAATIGAVAGSEFPHVEQLSKVAMATTVEDDFDRGLQMLIAGIAARSR